jgi:hypothetical protein
MAETIQNFLVGIGYDYDEKGQNQIASGIDGLASKALMLGSVVAGAFGISALTADFANATDTLGKFSETFDMTANDVAGLGRAIQIEGGTFESMVSQLEAIERLRAMRPDEIGGFFADAGIVGFDPSVILNAKNATEAYIALGDVMKRASQDRRLQIADVLGLDPASIRLLSRGTDGVRSLVEKMKAARPVTDEMTKSSAAFNDQLFMMKTNIGGVSDAVANELLPSLTESMGEFNEFMAESDGPSMAVNTIKSIKAAASPIGSVIDAQGSVLNFLFNDLPEKVADAVKEQRSIFTKSFGGTGVSPSSGASTIQINMMLDGQVLDQRIINVNEQMNQQAIDDLSTSTGG